MPLDSTCGTAPPLSRHAQRLATLKLIRACGRGKEREAKRMTRRRQQLAEHALAAVIEGADFLGEGAIEMPYCLKAPTVYLLVTMTASRFAQLCEIGAELEDDEPNGDEAEENGDEDEASLGSGDANTDQTRWIEGMRHDEEGPEADQEPSLGSCDGITDQSRWTDGYTHGDRERDDADKEPSLGSRDAEIDQTGWGDGNRTDREAEDERDAGDAILLDHAALGPRIGRKRPETGEGAEIIPWNIGGRIVQGRRLPGVKP